MDVAAPRRIRAPRLPAGTGPWLNGPAPAGWARRVTLVDFWTYSCVNCLRTLPALRAWHARYAAHGLVVLGVHTPEFPFEREPDNVARAISDLEIAYPVVLDNDRAVWSAFANRFWPHRYLIDSAGYIVHDRAGEGGEAATERAIRAALAALPGAQSLPPSTYKEGEEPEGAMGAVCVPATPELFAGYYRGVSGNPGGFREDRDADYADPGGYREGYIHLGGRWRVEAEAARFVGPGRGTLRVAFRGVGPNVVLAPPDGGAATVTAHITALDPAAPAFGDGAGGDTILVVDRPRLYVVPDEAGQAAGGAVPGAPRLLTLTTDSPGLAVYSLTFSRCC